MHPTKGHNRRIARKLGIILFEAVVLWVYACMPLVPQMQSFFLSEDSILRPQNRVYREMGKSNMFVDVFLLESRDVDCSRTVS